MIFRQRTRRGRALRNTERELRRRRLANLMSRRPSLETLEERRVLASTAALVGGDAQIDGSAVADTITLSVTDQGQPTETLVFADPGGITAGAGFTQDDPNTVSILSSDVTGEINIDTDDGNDTVQILSTPASIDTTVDTGVGFDDVVVGNTQANFGVGGSLSGILGNVSHEALGGVAALRLDNSGDNTGIDYSLLAGIGDRSTVSFGSAAVIGYDRFGVEDVTLQAGGGNDSMTVDLSSGNPLISSNFSFNGGSQAGVPGDSLRLENGSVLGATFNYDNANDGSVGLDGGFIQYTGLEPIVSTITAEFVQLNYSGADDVITLTQLGGDTQVNSTAGEITTFTNPIDSLTINGGAGTDTFNIPAGTYDYSLNLDGGFVAEVESISLDGLVFDGTSSGLNVSSIETVAISNSEFSNTTSSDGLNIAFANTSVELTSVIASGNASSGIRVNNVGTLTVSDSTANDNSVDGLWVSTVAGHVQITNGNYNGNQFHGIHVDDAASANLTSVTATGGLDLFGSDGFFGNVITGLTEVVGGTFSDNAGDGIDLLDVGDVVTNGVTGTGNDPGIVIIGAASYTDTDSNFSNNLDGGIVLQNITNDVSLTRTIANDNDADMDTLGDGLNANNVGGNLTINGGTFNGGNTNQNEGIVAVDVGGTITLQQEAGGQPTVANDNDSNGIRISDFNVANFSFVTSSGNGGSGFQAINGNEVNINDQTYIGNAVNSLLQDVTTANYTTTTDPVDAVDKVTIRETLFQHKRDVIAQDEVDYVGLTDLNFFGEAGNDVFVLHQNVTNPANAINMLIDGGAPSAGPGAFPGDKIVLADGGTAAFSNFATGSGTATPNGGNVVDFTDIEDLVLPDAFEFNNTLATATVLGSPESTVLDASIHSMDDVDYYKVTAHSDGVLQISSLFVHGLFMNLELEVRDSFDNIIASSTSMTDNEFLDIPVVGQEMYFVRVFGANLPPSDCDFGNYSLEIENIPLLPTPSGIHLDPASDSGMMANDNYTNDQTPTFFVQADLSEFTENLQAPGVAILTAAEAAAGVTAGVAVQVEITNSATGVTTTGFADAVGGSEQLFSFTPAADLDEGVYFAAASTVIFDLQQDAGGAATPATGESQLSEPLWMTIDVTAPTGTTPDLQAASDSGMFNDDNVTSKMNPRFEGTGEAGDKVFVFANGELLGQTTVRTDGSDAWSLTADPLTDGVYDITVEFEDLAGNVSDPGEALTIEIDTIEPNTPYLDLAEASDSGRHDDDNVTNDNTPTVSMTTHDANVAFHTELFTDYLKFRIYDRFEESDEVLIYDSSAVAAVDDISTPGDGFTSLTLVTATLAALDDGVHNLKLEAEDRAGNISHDFLLDLVIDTEAYLGDIHLHPDSDSGSSATDSITNDRVPDFYGVAEANNIVTIAIDDIPSGTSVSIPLDGDDAFQPTNPPYDNVEGNYRVDTNLSWDDGLHVAVATFEDLAGNRVSTDDFLFYVDTQGPQVTEVYITGRADFDIFTLKPETPEPTPRVDSLTITLQDLPERVAPFLYGVLDNNIPPLSPIVLVGDHSGPIAIADVTYNDINIGPGIATAEIVLTFDEPLPDDRFTLTLTDNLVDSAGNPLDGENNAAEPVGSPDFPTGDGIPGGDFIARFTVDSRPELATWSQAVVYADINGNFVWDPEGQDNDATNRDFVFNFGEITDAYFTGNFAQNALPGPDGVIGTPDDIPISPDDATSSGFDKMGAYGAFSGQYQFFLDTDDDGVGDLVGSMAYQVNAIPVAGNFFNSTADDNAVANGQRPRDEIGAFDGQFFYLDVDGDNQIDDDERFNTNLRGNPLVGDFNGDGVDDLAAYDNDTGVLTFNLISAYTAAGPVVAATDQLTFGFSGFGDIPVAGDMNLDGIDDIAMWVPGREGQLPKDSGEFHILVSDNVPLNPMPGSLPSDVFGPFSPAPLGNDLIAAFGDDFALPLLGNFDPPVVPEGGTTLLGSLTNELNPLDTTRDGQVTARDALVVINALSRDIDVTANKLRLVASLGGFQLDASQDGQITALDALRVINGLGQAAEAEMTDQAAWAAAADSAFNGLNDDDDDELISILASDQGLF